MRARTFPGVALVLLLVHCVSGAHAAPEAEPSSERVCGSVRSGGAAVRGAHVVAPAQGLLALTDSLGGFCLDGVPPGVLLLRAFAVGFHPAERTAEVEKGMGPVYIELVPLRAAGGWSAGAGGASGQEGGPSGSAAGSAASGRAGTGTPAGSELTSTPAGDDPGAAFVAGMPMLVLAADSTWILAKHKGSSWDSLLTLHDALTRRSYGPALLEAATWRKLGGRIHDLRLSGCHLDRPAKRGLDRRACSYLERAGALLEARAAALSGKSVSHDARVHLESLARASDAALARWATEILARARGPAGGAGGKPPEGELRGEPRSER
jgi:hypothetical protein